MLLGDCVRGVVPHGSVLSLRSSKLAGLEQVQSTSKLMKKALAITGVAAAATLTIGGLTAAFPEPAMAG